MTTGDGGFPLSFAQDQLWFLDQLRSGATEYLLHQALRLRGPLDVDALTAALTEIGARHEVLRTRYATVDGAATQLVDPPGPVPLAVVDLTGVPAADRSDASTTSSPPSCARPSTCVPTRRGGRSSRTSGPTTRC